MLDATDVLGILDQLDRARLVVWLDAGDTRYDCDLAQAVLTPMGFQHDLTAVPGLPARLVLVDAEGRRVDLHPVVFDRHGNGWQELGAGAWGAYPADGLSGVGMVAGRQVRCLTPQLQVRHHLGYPLGGTDRHDLGLLAERFGVAVPPAILPAAGGHSSSRPPETP